MPPLAWGRTPANSPCVCGSGKMRGRGSRPETSPSSECDFVNVCEETERTAEKDRVSFCVCSRSSPLHSSAALLSRSSHAGIRQEPHSERIVNTAQKEEQGAQRSSASPSNCFHPGLHQMFLTSIHPPIPPERLAL